MVRIENWCFVAAEDKGNYGVLDKIPLKLRGNVYGHPKISDGTYVTTTDVRRKQNELVLTVNNAYVLGEMNPLYENWCREQKRWMKSYCTVIGQNSAKSVVDLGKERVL